MSVQRQPLVGVLMLNTRFQRFPRDIGHADSLPFATIHGVVECASVSRVVTASGIDADVLNAFVAAGLSLVDQGADVITTSCGFLHCAQRELSEALPVPVVSSALLVLPQLLGSPGATRTKRVGILTFDENALGPRHLGLEEAERYPLTIVGMAPDSHFADVIRDRATANLERLQADVFSAAQRLRQSQPDVVVLECTNLAPWRGDVERALGVEVVDLVDVIEQTITHRFSA